MQSLRALLKQIPALRWMISMLRSTANRIVCQASHLAEPATVTSTKRVPLAMTAPFFRFGDCIIGHPLVSVVVTSYNDAAYLDTCLRSVAEQSYVWLECIVVDDASSDTSQKLIDAHCAQDRRFTAIRHPSNQGLAAARNTGLAACRGQFVCFLDADDFFMRDNIYYRLKTIFEQSGQGDPEYLLGSFSGWISFIDGMPEPDRKLMCRESGLAQQDFISSNLSCPFIATAPLMYTERFRQVGGFNTSLRQAEDWEMWYRCFRMGYYFFPCSMQLVAYRQKAVSMIKVRSHEHFTSAVDLIQQASLPCSDQRAFFFDSQGNHHRDFKIAQRAIHNWVLHRLAHTDHTPELVNQLFFAAIPPYMFVYLRRQPIANFILKAARRMVHEDNQLAWTIRSLMSELESFLDAQASLPPSTPRPVQKGHSAANRAQLT